MTTQALREAIERVAADLEKAASGLFYVCNGPVLDAIKALRTALSAADAPETHPATQAEPDCVCGHVRSHHRCWRCDCERYRPADAPDPSTPAESRYPTTAARVLRALGVRSDHPQATKHLRTVMAFGAHQYERGQAASTPAEPPTPVEPVCDDCPIGGGQNRVPCARSGECQRQAWEAPSAHEPPPEPSGDVSYQELAMQQRAILAQLRADARAAGVRWGAVNAGARLLGLMSNPRVTTADIIALGNELQALDELGD